MHSSPVYRSFFAVLFAAPAWGGPLSGELSVLLSDHPDLRRARIEETRAAYLPRFELSGDTGAERTDDPGRRQGGLGAFSMRRDKLTLTATQNLFNGFRDEAGIAAAQNTENTIRTQLRLEDERVQRGFVIAVDVLQAKSRLQVAKEQRVAFEGRLQEALARYKQLFGHLPEIAGLEEGIPPGDLMPSDLASALETAQQYHPALRQTRYQAAVAREQKRIARADYLPTLDLVGTLDYSDNNGTTRGVEREQSLLLRARWEFFSGFRTRARIESASRTLAARKDSFNFAVRRVEEDVRVAWDRLMTERRRVDLLNNAVNLAIEVFNAKKRLREAGKETSLNVLDAEREVFSARINQISAKFDARIASYLLARRTGMLTPAALGLTVN